MRLRATVIGVLSVLLVLTRGWCAASTESQPSEYRLKAAFLFNFAKFVEWPREAFTNSASEIVIGVLGDNPFGDELKETVDGKSINDRHIDVRLCRSSTDATNCHILFLSKSEQPQFQKILESLQGRSILTVGEADGAGEPDQFIKVGGMISFVIAEKKIRFRINDDRARQAGLRISSKLLSLALPASP